MSRSRAGKAFTLALVTAGACGTLGACSSGASTPPASLAQGDQAEGGTLQGKRFVYVAGANGDPNYAAVGCGAKAEAERLGATVEQQNVTAFTAAAQIPVLNAAVAGRPDGVLISPTDPEGLYAPLKAAAGRRIPVATVVNQLSKPDFVDTEVTVDNFGGGRAAARHLAEQAGGRAVPVSVFTFQAGGSKAADDEWKGFEEEVKKYPNLRYLGPQFIGADNQVAEATAKMNAVLSADPDLFGVFATFGFAGEGVLAAARQRGVAPVVVSAYSATTASLVEALKAGTLSAIVDYPFREAGAAAVTELANQITGKPVRKSVPFESKVYTKASFDDPAQSAALGAVSC